MRSNKHYAGKDPEHVKAINRKSNTNWRTERHDDYIASKRRYYERMRMKVIAFYGSKCVRCGITDPLVLQVDHINGDGYKTIGLNNSDGTAHAEVEDWYDGGYSTTGNRMEYPVLGTAVDVQVLDMIGL